MMFWVIWWHFALFAQYLFFILFWIIRLISKRLSINIKKRISFEESNKDTIYKDRYDFGFHVSSEGELSQCFALIEELLGRSHSIILFYTSPSVERKVLAFCDNWPNLDSRRVVLTKLDMKFLRRTSISVFSMCRYDFFPWLMLLGAKSEKFTLINATSIKWRNSNILARTLRRLFYAQFDLITTSSPVDYKIFNHLLKSGNSFLLDLRVLEIKSRQELFLQSSRNRSILNFFESLKLQRKTISFGSAWSEDILIFKEPDFQKILKEENPLICIFPHTFNPEVIRRIRCTVEESGKTLKCIDRLSDLTKNSDNNVFLVLEKGVLCESYSLFDVAVIGGGFGESVHSVLEPMLACCKTFCGRKVFRSTEVENFKTLFPHRIDVCQNVTQMSQLISEYLKNVDSCGGVDMAKMISDQEVKFKELLRYYEN